jgi:hypothetical protein
MQPEIPNLKLNKKNKRSSKLSIGAKALKRKQE